MVFQRSLQFEFQDPGRKSGCQYYCGALVMFVFVYSPRGYIGVTGRLGEVANRLSHLRRRTTYFFMAGPRRPGA
jgi:hypothetical protein